MFSISSAQISELTQLSETVIQGEVVKQTVNWNKTKSQIITENQIKVKYIYKGGIRDSIITVYTNGGITDEFAQINPHAIDVPINSTGLFFLKNENSNIKFSLISQNLGILLPQKSYHSEIIFLNKKYTFDEVEKIILMETKFPKLSAKEHLEVFGTNFQPRHIDTCDILHRLRNTKQIEFSFDSVTISGDLKYVEFDIMAKVNTPGLKFGKGTIFINYNQTFGSEIVSNGTVEIYKGEILKNPLYSLAYSVFGNNVLQITADAAYGSNELFTFSGSPAELLHFRIKIEDFSNIGNIAFDVTDISGLVYYWCQGSFEIFDQINLSDPITSVDPLPGAEISIEYTFENPVVTSGNTHFKIDIMAKASDETQYFGGAVEVMYNIAAFGPDVIMSNNTTFERGPLISNTNVYTNHYVVDLAMYDNNIRISTQASANATSGFSILGNQPIKLGTLIFEIADCGAQKDIFFNQEGSTTFGGHLYYTGNTPFYVKYKPVIVNDTEVGQVCGCADPVITSFAPNRIPAGMGEVLTIEGLNFLNLEPESKIRFRNGDDGGLSKMEVNKDVDIISWTNTKIEVRVPGVGNELGFRKPPCSGKFEIVTRCGQIESASELEIPYSILSLRKSLAGGSEKIALKDGLCIGFSEAIPTWARETFKQAMVAWCDKINMNIRVEYDNNSIANSAALDGINTVTKGVLSGNSLAQLVLCQNGNCNQTNLYIQNCGSGSNVLKEIDFEISEQALGGSMQNLYNYLLHEIGHALMLNHSKNRGITLDEQARYVMYYDQTNLNFNGGTRQIKPDDEEGAQKLFPNSAQAIQNCGFMPVSMGNCSHPCGTSSILTSKFLEDIQIFPNPSNGNITIESGSHTFSGDLLTIYSIDGKKLTEHVIQSENIYIEKSLFHDAGIYVIQILTTNGNYWADKIIIK